MNRRQQFLDDILNINPNYDVDLINKAYSIAEYAQQRDFHGRFFPRETGPGDC